MGFDQHDPLPDRRHILLVPGSNTRLAGGLFQKRAVVASSGVRRSDYGPSFHYQQPDRELCLSS